MMEYNPFSTDQTSLTCAIATLVSAPGAAYNTYETVWWKRGFKKTKPNHELTGPLINVNITGLGYQNINSDTVVLKLSSPDSKKLPHLGVCYKAQSESTL